MYVKLLSLPNLCSANAISSHFAKLLSMVYLFPVPNSLVDSYTMHAQSDVKCSRCGLKSMGAFTATLTFSPTAEEGLFD